MSLCTVPSHEAQVPSTGRGMARHLLRLSYGTLMVNRGHGPEARTALIYSYEGPSMQTNNCKTSVARTCVQSER